MNTPGIRRKAADRPPVSLQDRVNVFLGKFEFDFIYFFFFYFFFIFFFFYLFIYFFIVERVIQRDT